MAGVATAAVAGSAQQSGASTGARPAPHLPSPTTPTTTTGATAVVRALSAVSPICFANPGTTEMWILTALDQTPQLRVVLGLHENVCTGAADGYSRMSPTGAPASALLHLGPGLANGLANLHNARRAHTPLLVLVGDMATWHKAHDPLLNSDIAALARTVARVVATPAAAPPAGAAWASGLAEVLALGRRPAQADTPAVEGWELFSGPADSKVLVLTLPHDLSWAPLPPVPSPPLSERPPAAAAAAAAPASAPLVDEAAEARGNSGGSEGRALPPQALAFLQECAAAIRALPRGAVALYLGGEALLAEDQAEACAGGPAAQEQGGVALWQAGRLAAACGAALLCENAFARMERGAGLPHVRRLPYFPQEAARELSMFKLLLVVDARLPVANFGYDGGPSELVPRELLDADAVWELDAASLPSPGGVARALRVLADLLDPDGRVRPGATCGGVFVPAPRPPDLPPPEVALSPAALCRCVAGLQPERSVLVDESLTSGGPYWDLSKACPRFTHLTLTGGAIGTGPPLALGAALACPGRCVINLQADGSAMYTLQALWSQARERAHVVTVICANNSYSILKVECGRQRLPAMGEATRSLTDLGRPALDWVALAQGMGVRAVAARTCGELCGALRDAIARRDDGPCLIHALLP